MKPYTIKVKDKDIARALFGMFIDGVPLGERRLSPDEEEAMTIMERLGEWAEGITH